MLSNVLITGEFNFNEKISKKCSTDQRFIQKRNTTYKIETLGAYCPNTYIVNPGFTPSSLSNLEFCSTSRRWFSHSTTKATIAKKSKSPKSKKRKSKSKSLNKHVQKQLLKNIQVNSAFPLDIQCQKSTQQFLAKKKTQMKVTKF